MKKLFAFAVIVFVMFASTSNPAFALPSIPELDQSRARILALSNDLVDIAKSIKSPTDKDAIISLGKSAVLSIDKIDHIRDLLTVLAIIKSKNEREATIKFIHDRADRMLKEIDIELRSINLDISTARNNAIVLTGNDLKKELRKLQEILNNR